MAFLAVFVALKIAHRAGGYAGWSWIPTTCDLRGPGYHLVQLKQSVIRDFRGQGLGESDFRVRQSRRNPGGQILCRNPVLSRKSDFQAKQHAAI